VNQRKIAIPDYALAAAGLLALIVTFLPWWTFTESASISGQTVSGSASVNGWNAASHGGDVGKTITGPLAWIPMLLLLILGILAVVRAHAAPQILPGKRFYQIAAGVGALAALLVAVRWATYFKPPNVDAGGVTASASSGASFGTYLGLLLGLAVAGAGIWALRQPSAITSGASAGGFEGYQQNPYGTYPQPQPPYGHGQPQPQPGQPNPWVTQPAPNLQQTQRVPLPPHLQQPHQPPQYGQPPQAYGQVPPPGYPQPQPAAQPQQPGQQPPTWQ
jgi:hypothetical protein